MYGDKESNNNQLDDLDDFDGACPECGAPMQRIDSGHDFDYDCFYDRFVCMEDNCNGNVHVEPESNKILE